MALFPGIFVILVVGFTVLHFNPCDGCDGILLHYRRFWLKRHGMDTVCMETLLYSLC